MLETGPLETASDLRGTSKLLRRLVALRLTLNSTLDLDELLQLIIGTAAELLDCEAASLLLYDEKRPHLFFAAATGEDPAKLSAIPVPLESSLAGTIFRTNRPLIINDAEHDPRHFAQTSQLVDFRTRSLVGVPMRIKDRVTGVLEALNKKNGQFTEVDERMLSVIASHAAVAIHNARLVQALQDSVEKIEETDRLKSQFLAVASHELRTPLGIIIGYASFLRESPDAETTEHAEHVIDAAMHMRTLVEDMTNLTMLETDRLTYKPAPLAVTELLAAAHAEVEQMATAKQQTIGIDLPDGPLSVLCDEAKMEQALGNVVHNAVRFSPVGGQIVLGARRDEQGVLIWVQDNGIGIPPDQLERIFERFYQVEDHMTRQHGGLGIGLAISKGLVEAQGGRIWAESGGTGRGATIKIVLPAA